MPNSSFGVRDCPQHGPYLTRYCPGCYPGQRLSASDIEAAQDTFDRVCLARDNELRGAGAAGKEPVGSDQAGLPTHFACVTWLDAFSVDGQHYLEDVEEEPGMLIHSAGILLHETERVVCLARCYCPEQEYEPYVRNLIRIPRCNILNICKYPIPGMAE